MARDVRGASGANAPRMHRVVLVALVLVLLASIGSASPSKVEGAARVGVVSSQGGGLSEGGVGDDPDPSGKGLLVDGELGLRSGGFTLALFATRAGVPELTEIGSTGNVSCRGTDAIDEAFYAGGFRVRVHIGSAFIGVGLGTEYQRKTTTCVDTGMAVTAADTHGIIELHAGYTFPKLFGPIAL